MEMTEVDRFAIAHISKSRYGAPNFCEGIDVATGSR